MRKFRETTCLKESLDMFEEPRFVPGANLVQLSRLAAVNQVAGHHHCLLEKVDPFQLLDYQKGGFDQQKYNPSLSLSSGALLNDVLGLINRHP